MAADGYRFFESANHVWLTKEVPVKYLKKEEINRRSWSVPAWQVRIVNITAATTGMAFLSSRLYLKLTGEQIELFRGEVSFSIIDKYKGSN
jgi:predicted acetyltransferase